MLKLFIMLLLQFGHGKNIEQKYLPTYTINFLYSLNLKKYFVEHGLKTSWVGHQIFLMRVVIKEKYNLFSSGSREIEIKKNLKKMKNIINDISSEYPNFKLYILGFKHHEKLINQIIKNSKVKIITNFDLKQKIMMQSSLSLASSGSVTLD